MKLLGIKKKKKNVKIKNKQDRFLEIVRIWVIEQHKSHPQEKMFLKFFFFSVTVRYDHVWSLIRSIYTQHLSIIIIQTRCRKNETKKK
jgi:hypothetical protein